MPRKTRSAVLVLAATLATPVLMGAKSKGCAASDSPVFSTSEAPSMEGTWDVTYDDRLDLEITIGGSTYTEQLGPQGGTVTIDHDRLRKRLDGAGDLPEIEGVPIDPRNVRQLACDASVIPIVLGSQSEVLDVGRATRTIPTSARRALDLRDAGCTWPGCDAPPAWCDAHHIEHWAEGGPTTLDNLRLLCRRHHTATHEREHEGGTASGTDPPA